MQINQTFPSWYDFMLKEAIQGLEVQDVRIIGEKEYRGNKFPVPVKFWKQACVNLDGETTPALFFYLNGREGVIDVLRYCTSPENTRKLQIRIADFMRTKGYLPFLGKNRVSRTIWPICTG